MTDDDKGMKDYSYAPRRAQFDAAAEHIRRAYELFTSQEHGPHGFGFGSFLDYVVETLEPRSNLEHLANLYSSRAVDCLAQLELMRREGGRRD